jgi:hypothetical protein
LGRRNREPQLVFALPSPLRPEGRGGDLVGAQIFYRWPTEGWQRGRVARTCPRAGFTHVVTYGRSSALGAVVVDTLLDAASHGLQGRWLLLLPENRA